MKLLKWFLVPFLLFNFLYAQPDKDTNNESYAVFYIDALSYKVKDTSASKIDIFVQVPYSNIQFLKKDNKYTSGYEVTLTIFDSEKKNILWNESWKEQVTADDFDHTISSNNFNLSLKSTLLDTSDYMLRCIVEDLNSRKSATREYELHVPPFNETLSISSIMLIEKIQETPQGERIIPNVSHTIESLKELLPFYYEIYSNETKNVNIIYEINDKTDARNFADTVKTELKTGTNKITEKLEYPAFSFGEYELVIKICDTLNNILAQTGKSFYAQIVGIPGTITDLDLAIEQMTYITDGDEMDEIKEAETYEEKLQRYLAYWKSKDPTPKTSRNEVMLEYYRRINFANKNFSIQKGDGWRTDMGMVYVTLGHPDNVEKHPFNMNSKPYEVWTYYNYNRTFLFVDYTGFGDYRLVNNNSRDWNRYRY